MNCTDPPRKVFFTSCDAYWLVWLNLPAAVTPERLWLRFRYSLFPRTLLAATKYGRVI